MESKASRTGGVFIVASSFFCAAAGGAVGSDTPGTLTLAQAIRQAGEQNPVLRRARAAYEEASWKPAEALAGNIPHISVTGQHFFAVKYQILDVDLGTNIFPFVLVSPGTIFGLEVSWTVFDGFQTPFAFTAAKRLQEAARLETKRAEFELQQKVRARFYEALAAQLLNDVATQNVRTLEDHRQKTRDLLNQGTATRFDLLRVQTQLEVATPETSAADDDVAVARRALAEVIGKDLKDEELPPLSGTLPVPDPKVVPAGLKFDASQRPDLQALSERANAADQLRLASHASWYPKVTVFAENQFYNNADLSLLGSYRNSYNLGLSVSWNLFDGGASLARQHTAVHQQQQVEATADAARLAAPREFDQWKRKYSYNTALYLARRRAIDTAQESLRLARLGYGTGTRTSTDVLDSELDLFRARAGMIQAQLAAAEALISMETSLGRKLDGG